MSEDLQAEILAEAETSTDMGTDDEAGCLADLADLPIELATAATAKFICDRELNLRIVAFRISA